MLVGDLNTFARRGWQLERSLGGVADAFSVQQVDAAIEFVVNDRAIDRAQTVRYTAVFDAAEMPRPQDLHADGDSAIVTRS